jgi:hypothetical protein
MATADEQTGTAVVPLGVALVVLLIVTLALSAWAGISCY